MLSNVLIIGVGLIGGSLGLALKESPLVKKVSGVDNDSESLKKALEIGAIDDSALLEDGVKEADVVFLCTSPGAYASIIERIKPHLKPNAIISDVGSTKLEVMELLGNLPAGVSAIGGHPMAGSETQGINGADRYLFENAVYVLSPDASATNEKLNYLKNLLETTGARIKIMEAKPHDELVATISHIPHLLAAALVNLTGGESNSLMMAAGGFRDTTRIASSNPELWLDILFSNRSCLPEKLDYIMDIINNMKKALENNDRELMQQELSSAKAIRDKIPHTRKGLIPGFSDIVCIVPDRPGIIGKLGLIMDKVNINIVDIEILRVREGDGGTIRLGVPTLEDAHRAVAALQAEAIKAWVR